MTTFSFFFDHNSVTDDKVQLVWTFLVEVVHHWNKQTQVFKLKTQSITFNIQELTKYYLIY